MVAWVDTSDGRRWAASRGAIVALAGVVTYVASLLVGDHAVKWVGGVVVLVGAATVGWAYVHATRAGLQVPPLSAACWAEKHDACSGSAIGTVRPCTCACHGRRDVPGTQAS
jgi:hypothetical protein